MSSTARPTVQHADVPSTNGVTDLQTAAHGPRSAFSSIQQPFQRCSGINVQRCWQPETSSQTAFSAANGSTGDRLVGGSVQIILAGVLQILSRTERRCNWHHGSDLDRHRGRRETNAGSRWKNLRRPPPIQNATSTSRRSRLRQSATRRQSHRRVASAAQGVACEERSRRSSVIGDSVRLTCVFTESHGAVRRRTRRHPSERRWSGTSAPP